MFLLTLSMVMLPAFNIASLESDEKGMSYNAGGSIEYERGNKGQTGNRGDSAEFKEVARATEVNMAWLESQNKGFRFDSDGNIEYDDEGYAVLDTYVEMCGGKEADQECYECFECAPLGERCIPIDGCVPSCLVDDDCTRVQICEDNGYDNDPVCRLPNGRWELDRRGERVELNKMFVVDMDGEVEYDEDGYAKLAEYAEMCGGPDADAECFECFECNNGGNRCIPISGCVPTCEVDDDCTREQICVDGEFVCRLPGGRPDGYRDNSDSSDTAGQGSGGKGAKGGKGGDSYDDSADDASSSYADSSDNDDASAGQGSGGKGAKGGKGGDSDDDAETAVMQATAASSWGGRARGGDENFEAAVMKDSGIMAMDGDENVNYLTLLWCSLAAVALLAAGALMRYLRAPSKKVEVGASSQSRHMMVGGEIFF